MCLDNWREEKESLLLLLLPMTMTDETRGTDGALALNREIEMYAIAIAMGSVYLKGTFHGTLY